MSDAVRVLVVEDSPTDARLIQVELSQAQGSGFEVTLAARVDEALAKLCEHRYDVALLDLGLPDSAGFSSITRIQALCPLLPIVVLTGADDETVGAEAIHLGVQDYLAKGNGDGRHIARAIRYAIERKRAALERETTIEFLRLVNECTGIRDLTEATTAFFRLQTGCEAIGIRLREGDDYPYYEAHGFPSEFVLMENHLCTRDATGEAVRDKNGTPIMECMCGNVICGRYDSSKAFFTKHGSFWTNCTTDLLATSTEADRQARTRNRCNGEGYESVALIPLRIGEERLGLLQLNDRRKGVFSPDAVGLWERLADYLAVALAKFRAELENRRNEARLESMVRISQHPVHSIQQLLDFALDEAIALTESEIGYIYHYNPAKQEFTLNTWSKGVMEQCAVAAPRTLYHLEKTGIWGEAVRQARPIIVNDFLAPNPLKKGIPQGHVVLRKFLTIPVFSKDQIAGVVAVANKKTDYDASDVRQLALLMDSVWKITERISAEEALRESNEQLRKTADELARSNKDLEHFAYVAAHDLQEPLRSVRSFAQLLAKHYKNNLDAQAEEYIGFVVSGAGRMSDLVSGLLDYSRVSSAGRTLAPTDCEAALAEALAMLRHSMAKAGAAVTHDPLPTVPGDQRQLIQLFQNLVGNAIKFRQEGTTPRVHIGARAQDGAWLFSVSDNGIGIEPQYHERVFEIFRRLHGPKEYPGTGIGLALCKRIVERHSGSIWLEPAPNGGGTTFCFTLPSLVD